MVEPPATQPSHAESGVELRRADRVWFLDQRGAVMIAIPASAAMDGRGGWYHVERGVRGPLVPDDGGMAVVYVVCEPATPRKPRGDRGKSHPIAYGSGHDLQGNAPYPEKSYGSGRDLQGNAPHPGKS